MNKQEALIQLLKFTNLITDEEKKHMIENIDELNDEQIQALGDHLASEAQARIKNMDTLEEQAQQNIESIKKYI